MTERKIHREDQDSNGNHALLLVDVITDFDFEVGERLYQNAVPAAANIAKLKLSAKSAGIPVIYVNDNFGKWQDDFEKQVERIVNSSDRGLAISSQLRPDDDDYYVLKAQRSGFYETPLNVLLTSMEVSNVIIAGFSTDICVLFTAHDAYMRDYHVAVPADCSAAVEKEFHDTAIALLQRVADADISPSSDVGSRFASA